MNTNFTIDSMYIAWGTYEFTVFFFLKPFLLCVVEEMEHTSHMVLLVDYIGLTTQYFCFLDRSNLHCEWYRIIIYCLSCNYYQLYYPLKTVMSWDTFYTLIQVSLTFFSTGKYFYVWHIVIIIISCYE